nr:hypothetical protein CFP56_01160 [Quercus suber]
MPSREASDSRLDPPVPASVSSSLAVQWKGDMLQCALYDADGVGSFTEFRTYSFDGSIDNFSGQDNLFMSDYSQDDMSDSALATHNHNYDPANVYVDAPYVYLRVRGQDTSDASNISCAEMTTDESQILYASVRTTAIFSSEPGTVHGLFFYEANTQEIDMEYVSNITSQQNEPVNTGQSSLGSIPPLQLMNQATDGNPDDATYSTVLLPSDATTVEHEYRIDWLEGLAEFYIDGSLVQTYTDNVPTVPGTWIWNNWA